jgi:hypothetical protein
LVNGEVQHVGFSCVFCWRANGYAVFQNQENLLYFSADASFIESDLRAQ